MKFDSLYQAVFLNEKEELELPLEPSEEPADATGEVTSGAPEVPEPDNYDVEPAPVTAAPVAGGDAGALKAQIVKLEEFSDSLNGMESESLLKLVNDLDRPESLFAGIAQDTATEITRIAEITAGLVEILKGYIITSAKKQRDLAATGQ